MRKCNILVPIGCRSDEGLSKPIIRRLEEADWCDCFSIPLVSGTYGNNYQFIENVLRKGYKGKHKIDLMFCTADRIEMTAVACAAYHNKVKIAHFYAGVIDYSFVLFDDRNRWVITLYSDICFCEDINSSKRVAYLWKVIGKIQEEFYYNMDFDNIFERYNIYNTGISHLDDLEIDESLVPKKPYDLIVYNPPTKKIELIEKDTKKICNLLLPTRGFIWIEPNPDLWWNLYPSNFIPIEKTKTKPRPQFLGLLKNCERFITNSSSAYYEAPYLMKDPSKIIQVGLRNKERTTSKKLEIGASEKIVQILKKWWCEQNKDNM